MELKKGISSGIVAGIVFTIINFVFGFVPGTSEWYASVFPQMATPESMAFMLASTFLVGLFMGIFYPIVNSALSGGRVKKGVKYGLMVWLLTGLMWPLMMMGFASAYLWVTELVKGIVDYSITGAVVAVICSRKGKQQVVE